jgi:saccharopine dehydrogenase-like NADP-dependent oxidoreductase
MNKWGGEAAIGIPLSFGAQMIARGDIDARGVFPPESVINPALFFGELERRGIKIFQEVA